MKSLSRALDLVSAIEQRGNIGSLGHPVLQAQALRESEHEPNRFIRGGRISARMLELAPIEIWPQQIFAACGVAPQFDEAETEVAWDYLKTQAHRQGHSHHISLNYAKLIGRGVAGIVDDIDKRLRDTSLSDDSRSFLESSRIAVNGLVSYGRRYQAEAKRLLAGADGSRALELQRIITALEQVPKQPARTLFEAIQSMLLLHFGSRTTEMHSAAGRVDLYLGPYYERDLREGIVEREEVAEWIQLFCAQIYGLSTFSDCIVVGGCLADGKTPFCNDLSYFVLDAMMRLNIPGPEIGFRYTPGHPRSFLRKAIDCVRAGTGHPGFFYDPLNIAALQRAGMSLEHACDYANCNCVELTSAGRSFILSAHSYCNLAKPIEILLNGGKPLLEDKMWGWELPDPPPDLLQDYQNFEAFFAAYEGYLDRIVDNAVARSNGTLEYMQTGIMLPLSSAFIDSCIERARHAAMGGADCLQTFPNFIGFVNAVNSLAAIRHAVFETGRFSLDQLADACRNDFCSNAELHAFLMNDCPKYGNDDPGADALAKRIFERIARRLNAAINIYGQSFGTQYLGWRGHGTRGEGTAATPDGRRQGAALSGSVGGDCGTDRSGPTALMRSATGFDHSLASGGITVNMALSPTALRTDAEAERLVDLTLAYFDMGGMQIQYNCVSVDDLRDAQVHPEEHRNLLVRVAGYCDRFVDLERNVQDEIIIRHQHES